MWPNRLTPGLDRCTKEMSSSPPNSTLWPRQDPAKKRGPSSADRNRIASPLTQNAYDYERHSQIAGPLAEPPADGPYRVQFRRLEGSRPVLSTLLVLIALLFVGGFLTWLMLPAHWPRSGDDMLVNVASIVVTATTGIIGWFAFLNVATLCRATLLARDPVPVRPEPGQRVAFLTTIVPEAESLELVRPTLEAALRIRHDGELDVWLLDEGDDPDVQADVRRARRQPLQPARGGALEPAEGPAPRPHQARQLQRLARRPRRALRLHARRRPGPRAAAQLRRTPARLLPRSRRGVRRGPAGVRQLRGVRGPVGRVAAVPLPLAAPASRQRVAHSDAGRDQQRAARERAAADRRLPGLDHRGHGHQRDLPHHAQPRDEQALDVGLHARRRLRGGGAGVVHRLLQPAGPLVAGDRRGAGAPLLAHGAPARPARDGPLPAAHGLLPDGRDRVDPRGRQRDPLLRARGWWRGRPGAPVADALRGRRGAPDRPLLLQPAPQRQPAREEGLGGRGRDADLGPVGADLRGLAGRRGAAALARLRDDARRATRARATR